MLFDFFSLHSTHIHRTIHQHRCHIQQLHHLNLRPHSMPAIHLLSLLRLQWQALHAELFLFIQQLATCRPQHRCRMIMAFRCWWLWHVWDFVCSLWSVLTFFRLSNENWVVFFIVRINKIITAVFKRWKWNQHDFFRFQHLIKMFLVLLLCLVYENWCFYSAIYVIFMHTVVYICVCNSFSSKVKIKSI